MKAVHAAHTEKKNWKKEIYSFLLNYRATPHTTTAFPPSELLFNRKIRTKLPQVVMVSDKPKIMRFDKQMNKQNQNEVQCRQNQASQEIQHSNR